MSTKTIAVTSSWTKIFNYEILGCFTLYLAEQSDNYCKGSIVFMEYGNINFNEISVSNTRGIILSNHINRMLPVSFYFESYAGQTYEIKKDVDGILNIKLLTGTNISISITLYSGNQDKSIIITPREKNVSKSTFLRLNSYKVPHMKYATVHSISWMESNAISYDIELFDITNNNVLLSANLTNTSESDNYLGELSNLSSGPFRMELSVKRNGGNNSDKIFINSLTINYN